MVDSASSTVREKLTLLLVLVPWLLEHERVSVAEAAEHFAVDEEQIRASVLLLAVSGVPGATATYQHEDLFDIDWDSFERNDEIVITRQIALEKFPRFSAREASALIAGLQYLQALPQNAGSELLPTLVEKLSLGASAAPNLLAIAQDSGNNETLSLISQAIPKRQGAPAVT